MEPITPPTAAQYVWAADIPEQDKPALAALATRLTEDEKLSLPPAGDPSTPKRAVEFLKEIFRRRQEEAGAWLRPY
jgi:hypothetical protein